MGKFIDLVGKRYGRLVVIKRTGNIKTDITWTCRCDCGVEKVIRGSLLRHGGTKSCGCLKAENMTTHGMTKTPEYRAWIQMRTRCHSPESKQYNSYGGRGIFVCDEWLKSFVKFFSDIGPRPSSRHSIERLENSLGYDPSNCAWVSKQDQANNRRTNTVITLDGVSDTVANWARKIGLKSSTICSRLDRGWSERSTLTKPLYYRGDTT